MDCPFRTYGKVECVYKIGRECEDIEVCPRNSDSYCGNAVLKKMSEEQNNYGFGTNWV